LSRNGVKITGIVLFCFLFTSFMNWLTGNPFRLSPTAVMIVGELGVLALAAFWIWKDRKYVVRLRITWRKLWTGVLLALSAIGLSLGVIDLVHPLPFALVLHAMRSQPRFAWHFVGDSAEMVLLVGIAEELFFRGYLFEYMTSGPFHFRVLTAAVINGLLFGLFHTAHDLERVSLHQVSAHQEWIIVCFQYAYGLISCLLYAWTSNIVFVIVLHGLIDSPVFGALGTPAPYMFVVIAVAIVMVAILRYFRWRRDALALPG
jgi:membrane protease YdiL (CAAX protease family)